MIERIEHTHRYRLTPNGRAIAVLFTKAYGRVLGPGLSELDPRLPPELAKRSPLATAWRQLNRALDEFIDDGLVSTPTSVCVTPKPPTPDPLPTWPP